MIRTREQAIQFRKDMDEQAKLSQTFTFTVTVQAKPAATTVANMPIPAGADFQMLGYNGEYDAAPDGKEYLRILFRQKVGNRVWSNDPEPVASILTPGMRNSLPRPRYGYRHFPGRLCANDLITMEVTNAHPTETLEVVVSFIGVLWFVQ